jgi:hypothetical protein
MTYHDLKTGKPDMSARKLRASAAPSGAGRSARFQPRYHDEVSDQYLDALQSRIERDRTENFNLIPVCAPGW